MLDSNKTTQATAKATPATAKATPATAKPDTAKPDTAKPDTAKPATAKATPATPATAKPDTAKPATAKPDTATAMDMALLNTSEYIAGFNNLLDRAGIKVNTGATAIKSVRARIASAGGFIADSAPSFAVGMIGGIYSAIQTSAKANRELAIMLAILEESKQWMLAKDPHGKDFRSFEAFMTASIPTLSPSTLRLYKGAAKAFYLPKLRGTLPAALDEIAETEPGTACLAVGVMNTDGGKDALVKAVNDTSRTGKMNAKTIRNVVSAAKEAIGGKSTKNTDTAQSGNATGNTTAPARDSKATMSVLVAETKAQILKTLRQDRSKDETHVYVDAEDRAALRSYLQSRLKSHEEAMAAIGAMIQILTD